MRYTTPEWLLDNLEKRLRLALGQNPAPDNQEHLPELDPVRNVSADFPLSTGA